MAILSTAAMTYTGIYKIDDVYMAYVHMYVTQYISQRHVLVPQSPLTAF